MNAPTPALLSAPDGDSTNWLPAPADGFFLNMPLYQPEERMYRGECILPPVQRIGAL
jgi:hypothetical protein